MNGVSGVSGLNGLNEVSGVSGYRIVGTVIEAWLRPPNLGFTVKLAQPGSQVWEPSVGAKCGSQIMRKLLLHMALDSYSFDGNPHPLILRRFMLVFLRYFVSARV